MRARFNGNPEMVMAYFRGVAGEVRERLAALGAHSLEEIVGTVGRLRPRNPEASRSIGPLLECVKKPSMEFAEVSKDAAVGVHSELIRVVGRVNTGPATPFTFSIANSDRTVGAHLSGQILRRTGYAGLNGEMIDCEFHGVAGQSFGAFLISGLRFRLHGEANDYVGKGLSGGTIAISAGPEAARRGDVLAGNTVLYGATGGELYVAGRAGERFAVRNSGALAVIEGVGQHGCEYMTSGVVVLMGSAGVNFGSGMTGGLVYTLRSTFTRDCYNREFLHCTAIDGQRSNHMDSVMDEQEEAWLRRVLREHLDLTDSPRARRLLKSNAPLPFVRLEPVHLPCPIEQTWAPILSRLEKQDLAALRLSDAVHQEDSSSIVDSAC